MKSRKGSGGEGGLEGSSIMETLLWILVFILGAFAVYFLFKKLGVR